MWIYNRLLLKRWSICSSDQNCQQTNFFFREKKIRIRGLSIGCWMSWSRYLCNLYKLCIQTAPIRNVDCFFSQFPYKILLRDMKIDGTPFPDMGSRINIHKTSAISIDTKKNLRHKSWVSGATLFFLRIDAADLLKI